MLRILKLPPCYHCKNSPYMNTHVFHLYFETEWDISDVYRELYSVSPAIIASEPTLYQRNWVGFALTSSFGNKFRSIVVALYRFIPTQGWESIAGFTHYYTWSRIWVWAAGPSFRTTGTVASPGVTSLAWWRSMGFPSFSTLVWCPILTTLRWTSFTWVTRLPDTLHKMKFEVLTLGCDAVQSGSVLRSFRRSYHIYHSISFRTVDSQYLFFLFGIFGNNRTSEMSVKATRLHDVTSKKTVKRSPGSVISQL